MNRKSGTSRSQEDNVHVSDASQHPVHHAFDRFASAVSRWTGSPASFCLALVVVIAWAVSGPIFGFTDTWQLVINTGTTIVTFLMVFLIQQSQNKDSKALQMKLDELLFALKGADDDVIDAEDLDEDSLDKLARHYAGLAKHARSKQAGSSTA
ncbi:Predicted small integral membrane protein [Bordetella ansorpii]|uniref:Predicted small integral membrane protein n=1 Tax=Bordetella ansorpii TaxID=288768 RepID=A0A157SJD0_9BORD|nr:low affinity iron permease family protein [Bordetella ansorpii]SAI70303.1 Predicted small integral membrane protein [Bordetella ansorpii]